MSGVNRLLSMQTPRGGFGVWPGETEPVPWGTAYVTNTLIDAQKAGYPIPQARIDEAVKWMGQEIEKIENGAAGMVDFKYGMPPDKWEPYVHYVLALAGHPRKARAEKLVANFKKDAKGELAENLYLLKAAIYLAGDHRFEADLKKPDASAISSERSWDYSFYSDLRRRGFVLNVFQDLFGSDPAGEALADLVADGLKKQTSAYFSTQELSWGVSGLGKRVKLAKDTFKPPTLIANGKPVEPQANPSSGSASDRTWALSRASEYTSLVLDVPSGNTGSIYLVLTSEGVRVNGDYKTGGDGLRVTRSFHTLEGGQVIFGKSEHKLGDMIFSKVTLTNTGHDKATNIALVDRFPAGWEIENPRLGRGVAASWIDFNELWQPDYLDIRDDRLQVFGSLSPGESKTVVYTLRVVTAGSFVLPPVEAMAMYDPRVWAREAGERIQISGPWADFLN